MARTPARHWSAASTRTEPRPAPACPRGTTTADTHGSQPRHRSPPRCGPDALRPGRAEAPSNQTAEAAPAPRGHARVLDGPGPGRVGQPGYRTSGGPPCGDRALTGTTSGVRAPPAAPRARTRGATPGAAAAAVPDGPGLRQPRSVADGLTPRRPPPDVAPSSPFGSGAGPGVGVPHSRTGASVRFGPVGVKGARRNPSLIHDISRPIPSWYPPVPRFCTDIRRMSPGRAAGRRGGSAGRLGGAGRGEHATPQGAFQQRGHRRHGLGAAVPVQQPRQPD